MKVISIIKKRIENNKAKQLEKMEKWLFAYYSRRFQVMNYGKVAIPHFLEAQKEIENLKKYGLIEEQYKQIKKGVRVAC